MDKKTVLQDDATIYKKNRDTFNKDKFKLLSPKQKWTYFVDYYLKFVLLGVVLLIGVGSFIYTNYINATSSVLNITLIDEGADYDTTSLEKELKSHLNITKAKEVITIGSQMSGGLYGDSAIFTKISAGTIDLVITSQENFTRYAQQGMFLDLDTILPKTFLEKNNQFFEKASYQELKEDGTVISKEEPRNYGLRLDSDTSHRLLGDTFNNCIIGITSTTKNTKLATEALQYFFE